MRRFVLRLFRRRRLERDLDTELAFHRDMAAAAGNAIPLGDTFRIKESARDLWRFTLLENLWRDVVYGARGLRHSPTLVLTAVLSLALGIGANTAIFSEAVEFLLSRPPVTDPGSVVYARVAGTHAPGQVLEFIRQSGAFTDIAGANEESFVNWNDGVDTHPVFSVVTSKNFFTALGVPVALGRGILPSDPDEVVVLTDRFWHAHFNGDRSILGETILLDGKVYTVVGILPPSHRTMLGLGITPDVYLPRHLDDTPLRMYIRLKPGMSVSEARAALEIVATRLDRAMPAPFKYAESVSVTPVAGFARFAGEGDVSGTIVAFFAILLVIVGLVLLIACVNVAGLLLARAATRGTEIATRLALGASRGRLLQQLLVESLLLSLLGAGSGLALARTITALLSRIQLPTPIPIHLQADLDWRVALYAAFLTLVATLVCGLLPAHQAVKESIAPDLRRAHKLRLRRTLVTAQIAISLVVLTTGLLFLRNLLRSTAINPGFDVRHTIRATVDLPPVVYGDSRRIGLYVEQALGALDAMPGVDASAAARAMPFRDAIGFGVPLTFPDTDDTVNVNFYWYVVTPGYFKAMDVPILQGRTFGPADGTGDPVAIVNRAFVDRYLGGRTPIGTTVRWGFDAKRPSRIVGVVGGTKNETIGEGDQPQVYQPLAQLAREYPQGGQGILRLPTRLHFVLRSVVPPATQLERVRTTLRQVEPGAGLEVATLYSSIGLAFLPSQIGAALMGSAGVLGLLLAAIGLYGTMVYSVTRRTQEIGIRIALGASRSDISRMILLDAGKLVVIGSAIGLVIAVVATRPLAMFLMPGLSARDPLTFFLVPSVLALTGLIANWGPLRRALAVDSATSLRYE